jgi:NAD(P)H dehydrogenase (quinone)
MPKKVLVVTAHPSSLGLTHRIADAYRRGAESVGAHVEILDLYKAAESGLRQDFLTYENIRETPTDNVKTIMQQKIADADELVFVHPLWWMGPPAILKNFIDVNFSARFAFRYVPRIGIWSKFAGILMGEGKRIGMLKGKSACVFITCDGTYLLYFLMALPFWSIWHFGTFFYCGIKTRSFRVLDQKTFRPPADWDKFLSKIEKIGRNVGTKDE